MSRYLIAALCAALGLGAALLSSCQEVEQPSPVLTEKQWDKVKQHIYDYAHDEDPPKDVEEPEQAPEPEYKIGANYQDKIEFLGFSVGNPDKNEPLVAGETTTFRWYWRAKEEIDKNWKIFVHFDSKDTNVDPAKRRQNLDHKPLDGLFPTSKWPKGKIVEDVQKVKIRGDYPAGPAVPYIGFFRGKTRLEIKNEVPKTKDNRVKAPSLQIKAGGGASKGAKKADEKPEYRVYARDEKAAENVEVDGKLDESVWSEVPSLQLSPFGSAPEKKSRVQFFTGGDHLYVGAHLEDEHAWSNKKERDSNTWEEEVVEMFIDVDGDGSNYLELQVNPVGTIFDANFKERLGTGKGSRREQIDRAKEFNLEGLESAVFVRGKVNDKKEKDEFWSVELKIPLTSIPGVESADERGGPWAVNLYRFDRPTKKQTLSYAWNTAARGDFHQVDKFGIFRFGEPERKKKGEKLSDEELMKRLRKSNERVEIPRPSADLPAGAKAPPPKKEAPEGEAKPAPGGEERGSGAAPDEEKTDKKKGSQEKESNQDEPKEDEKAKEGTNEKKEGAAKNDEN